MPANLAGYLIFSLFIFRSLLSRVGRKRIRPTKRPDRGGFKTMGRVKFLQAGAFNMKGGGIAPSPLHPFLALMQEKDAKRKSRHQGCRPNFPAPEGVIRDAGQFDRVPDPFVVRSSFFVPYGYSSGRWMSGLPLSPPPSFGFLGCSLPPVPLPPPGWAPPPPVPPPSPSGFFGASGFF